jgi:hypothetical protein
VAYGDVWRDTTLRGLLDLNFALPFSRNPMSETRKLIRVFLASPGDLQEERRAAKSIVDDINESLAGFFGVQVELVGWEDTVTRYGRPQEIINRDLERCEVFVGMMWKKWGTPPQVGGPYTSGFEEEFVTSVERRQAQGKPEISLFFKDVEQDFLLDPGEDLKKVLNFKAKLIAEKAILFETFPDIREFERRFRRCILRYLTDTRSDELRENATQSQAPTTAATSPSGANRQSPFSADGSGFLQDFISQADQGVEANQIPAVDIARARLLISLLHSQTNDDLTLGVHDANLIYAHGRHFDLGEREVEGLIDSGLEHYSQENVPLWGWIAACNGFDKPLLAVHSAFDSSTERRAGALNAMRRISAVLSEEEQESFRDSWFEKGSPNVVRIAALRYLGEFGSSSSLTLIRKEFDRNDSATVGPAVEATIRIRLRDSREDAIAALYDLQTTSISSALLGALFSDKSTIPLTLLLAGVSHQDSRVRRIVLQALRTRGEVPDALAEQLLADSDAALRYEALQSLAQRGRSYSDSDARGILVKQRGIVRGALGLGGLRSRDGEEQWKEFKRQRLRSSSDKDLEVAATHLLDQEPYFILIERHFKARGNELREAIDNHFQKRFESLMQLFTEKTGGDTKTMEGARSLEDHLRKEYMRQGLDVIGRQAKAEDLTRMRTALRSGRVEYSSTDAEYFRNFGEWEDVQLLVGASEAITDRLTGIFLGKDSRSIYEATAKTIYALGRKRLPEVLKMISSGSLLVHLMNQIPDVAFRRLPDSSINVLLESGSTAVRKNAALKCIRALPKKRLTKLLESYIAGGQDRYYNVIHWLDLGVSAPRELALSAVSKVFEEQQQI